jgi:hypothetical protein
MGLPAYSAKAAAGHRCACPGSPDRKAGGVTNKSKGTLLVSIRSFQSFENLRIDLHYKRSGSIIGGANAVKRCLLQSIAFEGLTRVCCLHSKAGLFVSVLFLKVCGATSRLCC